MFYRSGIKMTDSERQILNKNIIKDLIGDDAELIRKFEIEFLQQAKESIGKIVAMFNQNDFAAIKEEAHYIKTSAKAIGAEQTADLLQTLEDNALNNDKATCKQQIILINQSLKLVYGAIMNEQ